jgi:hypothetical protein
MAHSAPVCPRSGNGADCHARVVTDGRGQPLASTAPAGYGRSQFQTAYNLPASAPAGTTIAIVDAYDHPNIQSDLNTYSNAYGYPTLPACSAVASGTPCFKKVNQRGGTTYPAANAGWALETSLDVEVAHATCPNCSIVLVEADSNSFANLMAAVDQAVAQGAKVVSNSYGGSEFSGETSYDYHFNRPWRRLHGVFGRQRLRRRVPGRLAVRHGRRRHHAPAQQQPDPQQRDRLERRRFRLQRLRAQAGLPGRQLRPAHRSRRISGRRPQYRGGRL